MLSVKVGSFTKNSGAGTQSITGLGFRPSVIILFGTRNSGTGFATHEKGSIHFFSSQSSNTAAGFYTLGSDNVSTTDFEGGVGSAASLFFLDFGVYTTVIDTSDGFDLSWPSDPASGTDTINYMALGGDDILANVVAVSSGPESLGNYDVTGFGFEPNMLIVGGINDAPDPGSPGNLGVAISSSKRWAFSRSGQAGATMTGSVNSMRTQRTDHCLYTLRVGGTLNGSIDFVQFLSDGVRLNCTNAYDTATNDYLYYLGLRISGPFDVGTSAKPTGAAPQTQTVSGLGFDPKAIALLSFGIAATTTITSDSDVSFGCASSSAEGAIWMQTKDNTLPTEANTYTSTTKALALCEGASTVDAECDATLGAGQFELNWTINNAVAAEICYIAFGGSPAPLPLVIPQSVKRTSYY